MSLMPWNPYDPFSETDRTMDRMFNRMRSLMNSALAPWDADVASSSDAAPLALDMTSDEKNIVVRAALPGFSQDDVDIDVRGNVLTISAESRQERADEQANWHIREMRYGKVARAVTLPDEVKPDKAEASLEDGILTVTLPRERPSAARKIAVKARNLLNAGKNNRN